MKEIYDELPEIPNLPLKFGLVHSIKQAVLDNFIFDQLVGDLHVPAALAYSILMCNYPRPFLSAILCLIIQNKRASIGTERHLVSQEILAKSQHYA